MFKKQVFFPKDENKVYYLDGSDSEIDLVMKLLKKSGYQLIKLDDLIRFGIRKCLITI